MHLSILHGNVLLYCMNVQFYVTASTDTTVLHVPACAPKVNAVPWLCPCRRWTERPRVPHTCRGPRATPGAGVASRAVKEVRLYEAAERTEGSRGRCIWRAPAAAPVVDWLRCRPSGTRRRHCDMSSASADSSGSSPTSVSPSPSSAKRAYRPLVLLALCERKV